MLLMRSVCSALAAVAGLALVGGALAQGIPMGSMKTAPDQKDQGQGKAGTTAPQYGPNQAQAPTGTPERVTPTYRDTTEDRIMREMTDDGAHDRNDTQR